MFIPFPNLCLEEKWSVVVGSCGCVCVFVLKRRTEEDDLVLLPTPLVEWSKYYTLLHVFIMMCCVARELVAERASQ